MKIPHDERLKQRWHEYWALENHDRPLVYVTAPKSGTKAGPLTTHDHMRERWLDTEYQIAANRAMLDNTYYGGEAYPHFSPNLGPDIFAAMCGLCTIEFGESTSWAVHETASLSALGPIAFNENNPWYKKIAEMTSAFAADSRGDYLVGITDLHPGTDGLVSAIGPENLSMAIFDNPELIRPKIDEMAAVYRNILYRLNRIIAPCQEGSTNWMGVWHPGKAWYVVSSDFSCLVSEEDYNTYILPGIREETRFLDASLYHLDGPGALRHLNTILSLPELGGVQWVPGSGDASAQGQIEVYRRIQAAGKCVVAYCGVDDIQPVCEALASEGLLIITHAQNQAEADDIVRFTERIYKEKRQDK